MSDLPASESSHSADDAEALRPVRMDASARTAGALAHEIANYLGTIRTMLYLLRDEVEAGSEAAGDLETVERTLDAALRFLEGLRAFVHPQPLGDGVTDLNAVLRGAELELRKAVPGGAVLVLDLSEGALWVRGAVAEVGRLMRLLVSAAAAGAEKRETIRVRTGPSPADGAVAAGSEGPLARVVVQRDRLGFDRDRTMRIFEPFVADRSHETGLLLSTVYAVVSASGGTISAESAPGAGTTLRITLPGAAAPAGEGGPP